MQLIGWVALVTALIQMTGKGTDDFQVTMTPVFRTLMIVKLRHDFHTEHTLCNTSGLCIRRSSALWDMTNALFPGVTSKEKKTWLAVKVYFSHIITVYAGAGQYKKGRNSAIYIYEFW